MEIHPLTVILATALALMPVVVWLWILSRETNRQKFRGLLMVFVVGIFSVIPIIYIENLWVTHPDLNPIGQIKSLITEPHVVLLITFLIFGMIEEMVKSNGVTFANTNLFTIKDVGTAIKFSIIIGLGFSFTENIFYFYKTLLESTNIFVIFITVLLRVTVSTMGHMTFSGIFGYFYGIAQFAKPFLEEEEWIGKHYRVANWLYKTFGVDKAKMVQKQKIWTGLLIASLMHALFNILLENGLLVPAVILILCGALYIASLLRRQSIHLPLTVDVALPSLMKKKDEEVVLELLGMWYREEKFQDVIDICNRLLEKDPSNAVVKLFKAHATEKKKFTHVKNAVKNMFSKNENTPTDETDVGVIGKMVKKNEKPIR